MKKDKPTVKIRVLVWIWVLLMKARLKLGGIIIREIIKEAVGRTDKERNFPTSPGGWG